MSTTAIIHARGTLAARPAAGSPGHLYFVTDTSTMYRDNGSSWDSVEGAGGLADMGTVTYLDFTTAAAPANPAAGKVRVYSKTGDTLAERTSGGVETVFGVGGGGVIQAYVGKNAIGASSETGSDYRQIVKKITLANACLITDIEVYLKNNAAAQAGAVTVFLYDDVTGKPVHLLAWGARDAINFNLYRVAATAGDARWFGTPLGYWAAAGDYWIGFQWTVQGAQYLQYYDTAGSDYYWDKGGNGFITDAPDTTGTVYVLTNSTKDYSIRANTIR